VNTHLLRTISVRWAEIVDDDFHARFSAVSRRYRYIIYNQSVRSAILASRVTWFYYALDAEKMQKAAQHLLGEHDFTSFRAAQCEAKSPIRTIEAISVKRQGSFVIIEIQANAFLHHMVRNIAGVLMRVGTLQENPDWIIEVLKAKSRAAASETAAPTGLYLTHVYYPEPYHFPLQESPFLIP
jgi:tRNA pseudouridine38-40 synthase